MRSPAKRLTQLALATSLLLACGRETVDPVFILPTAQERAETVCGDDGQSYDVQEAETLGIDIAYRGSCDFPMQCDPEDPAGPCFIGDRCSMVADSNALALAELNQDAPNHICVPAAATSCDCRPPFAPVCGSDARTYSSECDVACAGVDVAHPGYCEPPPRSDCVISGCAGQYCVEAGVPVVSSCEWDEGLACYEGATCGRLVDGACGFTFPSGVEPCEYDPATPPLSCDVDQPCQAGWTCATALVDPSVRVCIPCDCADDDLPVCGTDGETYSNPCYADCAGTNIASLGPCEP